MGVLPVVLRPRRDGTVLKKLHNVFEIKGRPRRVVPKLLFVILYSRII